MDVCWTELAVRLGAAVPKCQYRAVPNDLYKAYGERMAEHVDKVSLYEAANCTSGPAVGNVLETYAAVLLAKADYRGIMDLLLGLAKLDHTVPGEKAGMRDRLEWAMTMEEGSVSRAHAPIDRAGGCRAAPAGPAPAVSQMAARGEIGRAHV